MARSEVRRVRAHEWDLFRDVRLRALLDAPDAFLRTHAEESAQDEGHWKERTAQAAISPTSAVYVALDAPAHVVGMAGGWQRDPDRVVVWGVWVVPAMRGAGIGATLVAAVEQWAVDETAASELSLEVVEGNDRAAAFYERLGFAPSGVRMPFREGTGLSEIELIKKLAKKRGGGQPPPQLKTWR